MHIIDKIEKVITDIQVSDVPYFNYEYWNGAVENLTAKDMTQLTMGKKFPLVLLLLPINYTELDNEIAEADLNIYIFGKSELKYSTKQRHELTFPIIRTIKDNFKKSLKWNSCTYGNINVEEIFYNKTKKNKLDSVVDAIFLKVQNLRYQNTNC